MSYWPATDITPRRNGLDYQGRYPDLADTYPTEPAALHSNPGLHLVSTGDHGAAHVCTEIDSDRDDDDKRGQGAGVFLVPGCMALSLVAAWALFAWLTAGPL